MSCRNRLAGCTHSYGICPQKSIHFNLCRAFKIRSCSLQIDSFPEGYSFFLCSFSDQMLKFLIINMSHIRESGSQFLYILSDQRRGNKACNLIPDHHKIACRKLWIDSTGCIRQKQNFYPNLFHQSDRKNYLFHRISFIIMHSAFHDNDRYFPDPSQ